MGCANCKSADATTPAKSKLRSLSSTRGMRGGVDTDGTPPETSDVFDAPLGFTGGLGAPVPEPARRRRAARETSTQKAKREWIEHAVPRPGQDASSSSVPARDASISSVSARHTAAAASDLEQTPPRPVVAAQPPRASPQAATPASAVEVTDASPSDDQQFTLFPTNAGRTTDNVMVPITVPSAAPQAADAQVDRDATAMAMLRGQRAENNKSNAGPKADPKKSTAATGTGRVAAGQVKRQFFFMED